MDIKIHDTMKKVAFDLSRIKEDLTQLQVDIDSLLNITEQLQTEEGKND